MLLLNIPLQPHLEINLISYYGFILMITVGLALNIYISAKLSQRLGVGKAGDYGIGLVAGATSIFVAVKYIETSIGFMYLSAVAISLGIAVVLGLTWVSVKNVVGRNK